MKRYTFDATLAVYVTINAETEEAAQVEAERVLDSDLFTVTADTVDGWNSILPPDSSTKLARVGSEREGAVELMETEELSGG